MIRTALLVAAIAAGAMMCAAGREDDSPTQEDPLRWVRGEGYLALTNNDRVIWRFNHGTDAGKPHFHPVALPEGPTLTWQDPPDHPWHHGLWFSWKLINGVNYWEEDRATGLAAGRTGWTDVQIVTEEDHSARIEIDLTYREPEGEPVLTERRVIDVSPPAEDGTYHLDWTMTFMAEQDALLDRTPLPHEQGGKVYGGYAGLSVRFVSGFEDRQAVSSSGEVTFEDHRHRSRAVAMEYNGVARGVRAGIAIFDHPENLNAPSPWYVIREPVMSYFSPAVICYGQHLLPAGESMTMRYRVVVHGGQWNAARLVAESGRFVDEIQKR